MWLSPLGFKPFGNPWWQLKQFDTPCWYVSMVVFVNRLVPTPGVGPEGGVPKGVHVAPVMT